MDSSGNFQGLFETVSNGAWTASGAPLPQGASTQPYTNLWGVSCVGTVCAAVGSYVEANNQEGLLDVLTPPSAPPPTAAPPPTGQPGTGGSAAGGCDLVGSEGGVFVFPTWQSSGFFGPSRA